MAGFKPTLMKSKFFKLSKGQAQQQQLESKNDGEPDKFIISQSQEFSSSHKEEYKGGNQP